MFTLLSHLYLRLQKLTKVFTLIALLPAIIVAIFATISINFGLEGWFSSNVQKVVEIFDLLIESSIEGCRKPEEKFYEVACERLNVKPENCVFLDDLGINLKPARAMGMTTIKVIDPEDAIKELYEILGITSD